jgi:hypothetical protein
MNTLAVDLNAVAMSEHARTHDLVDLIVMQADLSLRETLLDICVYLAKSYRELQQLRAENEALKAKLHKVEAITDTLYQDAPTEDVATLIYYLSVMTQELKEGLS